MSAMEFSVRESRSLLQRDEIRGDVMNVRIPPLGEHVDVPLQRIGDDELRNGIVAREAAIRAVWLSQCDDEGGEMVQLSLHDLAGGKSDRDCRRRHLGRRGGASPDAHAASGDDQILNRLGVVLRANARKITPCRVTLGAPTGTTEVRRAVARVADEDVERARRAAIGEWLSVQPCGDVADLGGAQGELRHAARGNPVLDDQRDYLSVLIAENDDVAHQVRSRLTAAAVRAVTEGAIAPEQLLPMRHLLRRRGGTHRIIRSTFRTAARGLSRLRRSWWILSERRATERRPGEPEDSNEETPATCTCVHQSSPLDRGLRRLRDSAARAALAEEPRTNRWPVEV